MHKTDIVFLEQIARDVLAASLVHPGQSIAGSAANCFDFALVRPGGRECYPSFWIRDFTMSLDSGLIDAACVRNHFHLCASRQADEEIRLPSGATIPAGSIPDHINFDGTPIFFPGTYSAHDQGGDKWGYLPTLDDSFFFIQMGHHLFQSEGWDSLQTVINGKTLLTRMEEAFAMPPVDSGTELVTCTDKNRGVSFGFTDSILMTGHLAFASILRHNAARALAGILEKTHPKKATAYETICAKIKTSFAPTFASEDSLLRAATGTSGQKDVWVSVLAALSGLLSHEQMAAMGQLLARSYTDGTLAHRGNIRHVRTCDDFDAKNSYEKAMGAKNTYQNGAYWGTPTGWVCEVIARVQTEIAGQIAQDYIAELRENDFRKGPEFGAPFECFHPEGNHRQNPVYLTSVTMPLASFQRLGWCNL